MWDYSVNTVPFGTLLCSLELHEEDKQNDNKNISRRRDIYRQVYIVVPHQVPS